MYRKRVQETDLGFVGDVLKIALGVFIGCMASVLTYEKILSWRVEQAAKVVMQELKLNEEKQAQARELRLQEQRDQQDRLRKQALEKDWERQQQVLAARRKEQAWSNFYQPSFTCRADPSRGDCADSHIRARTAFEAQYRD